MLEEFKILVKGRYRAENRSNLMDQIAGIVLRKENHFPSLKQLVLHLDNIIPGQGFEALQQVCVAKSVCCRLPLKEGFYI